MNIPKVYDSKGNELVVGVEGVFSVSGFWKDGKVTGYSTRTPNADGGMTLLVTFDGDSEMKWHARPNGDGSYTCSGLQVIDFSSSTQQTTEEAASAAPEGQL
jgi:hypothetical protein